MWREEEQGCGGGQSPGGPGCGGMKPPPSRAESFKYGLGPGTQGAVVGSQREGRAVRGGQAEQGECAGAAAARPIERSCPSSPDRSGRCARCLEVGKRLSRAGPATSLGRSPVSAGCAGSGAGECALLPVALCAGSGAPSLTTLASSFGLWAGIAFWSAALRMGIAWAFYSTLGSTLGSLPDASFFFSLSDLKQMRFSQEAERPPKEAVLWLGTPFWSQSPGLLFVFSLFTSCH